MQRFGTNENAKLNNFFQYLIQVIINGEIYKKIKVIRSPSVKKGWAFLMICDKIFIKLPTQS